MLSSLNDNGKSETALIHDNLLEGYPLMRMEKAKIHKWLETSMLPSRKYLLSSVQTGKGKE